jgi:Glycosyl hydrolase family 26
MRHGSLRLRALTALCGTVLATVSVPAMTSAEAKASGTPAPVLFGTAASSAEELASYERLAGRKIVGYRRYRNWDDRLFDPWQLQVRDTRHIPFSSLKAITNSGRVISWSSIAAATPGSAVYQNMVDRAHEARAYGNTVYLAFNHEPEAVESARNGNAASFVAAWRKIRQVFAAQGATNVVWIWTMTAWAFTEGSADPWYPGDSSVDAIAADGYNWNNCRTSRGRWVSFSTVFQGLRDFGARHPTKQLMVLEFGSVEDNATSGRKAAWWNDARQTLRTSSWGQFSVVLTWNGRNYSERRGNCNFDFASSASSKSAWIGLRQDWFLSTWRVQ